MKVQICTENLKTDALPDGNNRLLEPLVFGVTCKEWHQPFKVVVPGDYVTDFESVPKLLVLSYTLIKGRFKRASTGHDFLVDRMQGEIDVRLDTSLIPFKYDRAWADRFFYAAMLAESQMPGRNANKLADKLARNVAYMGVSAYTLFSGE